ncbi:MULTISPECIES: LysM peptidoglycan-binding domain-containing protein [Ramlibacter]|uniref:LysM peptidoglycan-binding domain-containing protein n=1 Tax=Ramlibacter aquaticus TaxID=2780094 RepID=A0ABR9SAM4_9BURK|nr:MULTISPECIES: LysM peptidoglycan-binding domain-containing protein [Ramlibacter]MBE7939398.1 LysM peptidoglycan-binding domain-containing protein [Ramlibacter aquaticus]
MKKYRQNPSPTARDPLARATRALGWGLALAAFAIGLPAQAQSQPAGSRFPVTPGQRATAQQVASAGVPLSELSPNAPERYTVKRGDTLWAVSGLFLKSPWRWPELWGMNLQEIRNPHLIYPGQLLVLEKQDGMARLRVGQAPDGQAPTEVVRLSPRVRAEPLADSAIPALQLNLIEAFLTEPLIVDEATLNAAPRIVAAPENRVMITRGDRAYARGLAATPLKLTQAGRSDDFRVFRNAKPLRDPADPKRVLGYEAEYLGQAQLVRSESSVAGAGGKAAVVPATIDIVTAKEEMRVGDRLLPEPPRQFPSYVPHAPQGLGPGRIVSVYGDAVSVAGQNQVVVIDKGSADGIEPGHVFAILKDGRSLEDRTQEGERAQMQLPDERNGLLMVFRPFEHLSYALILEITDTVKVGDRVASPR